MCEERFPDATGHLGLWQREYLARIERIYKTKGAKFCGWHSTHGIKRWNATEKKPTSGYRFLNGYFMSAVKMVQMGYLMVYERCGPDENKIGFVPAYAPEGVAAALLREGSVWDVPDIAMALRWREQDKTRDRKGGRKTGVSNENSSVK